MSEVKHSGAQTQKRSHAILYARAPVQKLHGVEFLLAAVFSCFQVEAAAALKLDRHDRGYNG